MLIYFALRLVQEVGLEPTMTLPDVMSGHALPIKPLLHIAEFSRSTLLVFYAPHLTM